MIDPRNPDEQTARPRNAFLFDRPAHSTEYGVGGGAAVFYAVEKEFIFLEKVAAACEAGSLVNPSREKICLFGTLFDCV